VGPLESPKTSSTGSAGGWLRRLRSALLWQQQSTAVSIAL